MKLPNDSAILPQILEVEMKKRI